MRYSNIDRNAISTASLVENANGAKKRICLFLRNLLLIRWADSALRRIHSEFCPLEGDQRLMRGTAASLCSLQSGFQCLWNAASAMINTTV